MITTISNASANPYTTDAKGAANSGWKVGDIMPGSVVSTGKGSSIVNIQGNNYWLNSSLKFSQGESLMLKVAGLTPMVHFSLVERARGNVGTSEVINTVAQEKILQNMAAADRNLSNAVSSLIGLLHFGSAQSLPPATQQLLDTMRRRLMRSSGLSNPSLIRHSVLNGSIVNGGSTAIVSAGNTEQGLQPLLQQIVESLTLHRGAAAKIPALANYQNAFGIAQYQNNDGDAQRSFARSAEEQFLNLTNAKSRSPDELPLAPYRLSIELPVLFRDHISSISILFTQNKHGKKKNSKDIDCSAEFELELPACGAIYTTIAILGNSVSIHIGCAIERVSFHLTEREKKLQDSLAVYGLKLETFRCEVSDGHLSADATLGPRSEMETPSLDSAPPLAAEGLPTEEEMRERMRQAHDEGKVPDLNEFKLQIENQTVALETEIPVELYCAMASFFVQLLEIENA